MNHPVLPSVCLLISFEPNFSLRDKPKLVKLYTVAVYNLRMCMEEDNPGQ